MKVYVATRYEDKAEAARWIQHLRDLGIEVTHDWTAVEEAGSDFVLRRSYACADMQGVRDADVVWVLAPEDGGRGCWTELGAALALHKYVVVSGPGVRKNIFDTLASITAPSHLEGFEFVQGFKRLLAMEQEKTIRQEQPAAECLWSDEGEDVSVDVYPADPETVPVLTTDSVERKRLPIYSGVVAYFHDALSLLSSSNPVSRDYTALDCADLVATALIADTPVTLARYALALLQRLEEGRLGLTSPPDCRPGAYSSVLGRYPLALAAMSAVSLEGNEKHNPGEPLGWARAKSADHLDCCARHLIDHSTLTAGRYKDAAELAWRALANLQTHLESQGAPRSRGSR